MDDDCPSRPPRILVKWNLKQLAADLALHLDSLDRSGKLWDTCLQSEEYLEPYGLSPEDENTVTILAWGAQCMDCGDTRDYYMADDRVWRDAGLEPHQYCCRKCLSVRLGRPLEPMDFTLCPLNERMGVVPEPIDADLQAGIDRGFDTAPAGLKDAFEDWAQEMLRAKRPT